jgi:hypothetical protein
MKGTRRIRTIVMACMIGPLVACGPDNPPSPEDVPLEPAVEPAAPGAEISPLTPPDAPVYVGVWAADRSWCDIRPGSADPSPIAITAEEFLGYENRCRIGDIVEGTDGGYALSLVCQAEGVEYDETVEVDVGGDMLTLTRPGAEPSVFLRCEGK